MHGLVHPTTRRVFVTTLLGLSLAAPAVPVLAQDGFPSRTITLVVPFAAGSGTDIGARLLAKDMGAHLGTTVVVDNKPGANGAIGAQAAARARPDGYTLMIGNATSNAANYAFFAGRLGYTPASFEVVGGLGASPISLYVAANAPWRTLEELLADIRRKPARWACGSGNATTQVACEVFRRKAALDVVTVPYKGNPQSLADVVGGQIAYAFSDAAAAQALVESRRVRALAVASPRRSPAMPDVPTFVELGHAGFEIGGWSAVFVPAGTPAAIADKLNAAIRKANDAPEAVRLRERTGGVAMNFSLAEARQFVADEITRWAQFVELSGVKPEQ